MKPNLRSLYASLQALPRYVASANTLSEERAQEIAQSFGDDLAFLKGDFDQANAYGKDRKTHADTQGNGLGMYNSVERLFFGYVYDMHYQGACESEQASRQGEFDE